MTPGPYCANTYTVALVDYSRTNYGVYVADSAYLADAHAATCTLHTSPPEPVIDPNAPIDPNAGSTTTDPTTDSTPKTPAVETPEPPAVETPEPPAVETPEPPAVETPAVETPAA